MHALKPLTTSGLSRKQFFAKYSRRFLTAFIVDSAYASFIMCQLVANTLSVGDDVISWGMMSPSQSDWERWRIHDGQTPKKHRRLMTESCWWIIFSERVESLRCNNIYELSWLGTCWELRFAGSSVRAFNHFVACEARFRNWRVSLALLQVT